MKLRYLLQTIAMVLALAIPVISLAAADRVNINSASAEQIAELLVGIGPSKAEAIVAYREEFGPFEDVDELINVRGIGLRTVDQNRDRMSLSNTP